MTPHKLPGIVGEGDRAKETTNRRGFKVDLELDFSFIPLHDTATFTIFQLLKSVRWGVPWWPSG